jgi:hypothetical protein
MRVRWTTDAADDLERSSTVASVHTRAAFVTMCSATYSPSLATTWDPRLESREARNGVAFRARS